LTYADGKPFYWLGEIHWTGFSIAERFNESNDARFNSIFKGMIDTVWKVETFANNNGYNSSVFHEGGQVWNNAKFSIDLNPGFWQNIDQHIEYLASKGMVISIAQGLAVYILARYGAYATVWMTAQEFNDVRFGICG
jgi:hypothetical protein